MEDLNKIICFFKSHKRGKTHYNRDNGLGWWEIECARCKYKIEYNSPYARLVSTEMDYGFDGN